MKPTENNLMKPRRRPTPAVFTLLASTTSSSPSFQSESMGHWELQGYHTVILWL